MISHITPRFSRAFSQLPAEIRREAKRAYKQWKKNSSHASLEFKEISLRKNRTVWSVRITDDYRALGDLEAGEIFWFWCGSHTDYEKLIETLRKARGNG